MQGYDQAYELKKESPKSNLRQAAESAEQKLVEIDERLNQIAAAITGEPRPEKVTLGDARASSLRQPLSETLVGIHRRLEGLHSTVKRLEDLI